MLIRPNPPLHLTYSLNVHPGETWDENFRVIREVVPAVRRKVGREGPFGLGLRLSRQAADALKDSARLDDLRAWLAAQECYVFTINAFPYGAFHGTRVKEQVYAPDWRMPERLEYTLACAEILTALLPKGVTGSISTVPGSFKPWISTESDMTAIVTNLEACTEHLAQHAPNVLLALEPEPGCLVETTGEAVRFFLEHLSDDAREHIGLCLDTCHLAVQFEKPADALKRLASAGIRVAKVQLSAAIETKNTPAGREALEAFAEPVYLHQAAARGPRGVVRRWLDLTDALRDLPDLDTSCTVRTHYHVPLYWRGTDALRPALPGIRDALLAGMAEHLEIETYTFNVLPPAHRLPRIEDSIAREYAWTLDYLGV